MEVSKYIAQRIKALRKERGLTQKELGNLVGVKDNTISGYEHNINDPGNDMLFMLANALRVSINEFFPETVTKAANSRLSVGEQEHIEKYRALTEEQREAVDGLLNHFFDRIKASSVTRSSGMIEVTIPVVEDERAKLHRLLDEELDKEKEGRRVSSYGSSATGSK